MMLGRAVCLTLLSILIIVIGGSCALDHIAKRSTPELDILPNKYFRNIAPVEHGHPVMVKVSVIVLNLKIGSINTQDYEVDIFYHNEWKDYRLQKPTNVDAMAHLVNHTGDANTIQYRLKDIWKSKLWIPDVYFRNALAGSVSNILTPTYYFTVTNYTQVFMAVRLNLKLTCHMDFYRFPFDTQTCYMNITSTTDDYNTMRMEWQTFRIGSHVDESEFNVVHVDHESNCVKHFQFGAYSCLYGRIVFKRNVGKYLIKRLIPSFIIVMITFIGFWIPTNISPARTALPITALLALITQQIQSDLNVSYVYALQVWNIVCIVFVFANLLEFAVALYISHRDQKQTKPEDFEKNMPVDKTSRWPLIKRQCSRHFQTTTRHSSIDKISRYLFPLLYLCFIVAFAFHFVS